MIKTLLLSLFLIFIGGLIGFVGFPIIGWWTLLISSFVGFIIGVLSIHFNI